VTEFSVWTLAAILWWLGYAALLAREDLRTHRLPLRHVAAMSAGSLALLAGTTDWARLGRSAVVGAALAGLLFLLCLPRRGIGLGDAALAFPVGVALGWAGWAAIPIWLLTASLLITGTTAVLLLARRIAWRSTLPLGPFLLGAVLPAVLLTPAATS